MIRNVKILVAAVAVLSAAALLVLPGRWDRDRFSIAPGSPVEETGPGRVRVGYRDTPLLGVFYAAQEHPAKGGRDVRLEPHRFGSGGDVGYALLSGEIDAGFVETDKAIKLLDAPGGSRLKVAGAVEFPYGAVLVVRKDLRIRLGELPGRKLAALEPDCAMFHQFLADARRLGVDVERVRFSFMPQDEMLPALEAKAIDGAVLKGSYAVLAEAQGHKILYQKWDMQPGDDCCPPVIAQVEYFLVVRELPKGAQDALLNSLTAASALPPPEIRKAILRKLGYPTEILERFPVATFSPVRDDLRKHLGTRRCAS